MKYPFYLYFIIFVATTLHAQQDKYQRISIPQGSEVLLEIQEAGLPVGFISPDNALIMELSDDEIKILDHLNLNYKTEINDLELFYQHRNQGKDAREILDAFRESKTYNIPENFALGSMGGFCTYTEMLAHLDTMHALFPNLISQRQALPGQTIQGRDVYWLRISDNPNISEDEPGVFYNALIHAREPGSMQQMLYYMYYLLENYNSDSEIKTLVDNTQLYFVPCVNPDGYIYNETTSPNGGGLWRKNRQSNSNGSIGVDLNRNFGFEWGHDNYGSSPNPTSNTYRGEYPFSEPETQILKSFGELFDFSLVMNYHSYGNLLLHPWGYVSYLTPPDYPQIRQMASYITYKNNFDFGSPSKLLYLVNGDATDWFYGHQDSDAQRYAYTPEVGLQEDGFWPPIENIIPQCQDCLEMNLRAAQMVGFMADIMDDGSANITQTEGWLSFSLQRTGLSNLPFSVMVEPLSEDFLHLDSLRQYASSPQLTPFTDSIFYQLASNVPIGKKLQYLITIQSETFTISDTITKIFGTSFSLFQDDFANLNHWNTDEWSLKSDLSYSPQFSVCNISAPYYPDNSNSFFFLNDTIFTEADALWLNFKTRWDMDGGKDYVRLLLSDDLGQSWKPLKGRHTSLIWDNDAEVPVYSGYSQEWRDEWILIDSIAAVPLLLGFTFESDAAIGRSGFYLDDFKICSSQEPIRHQEIQIDTGWAAISSYLLPWQTSIPDFFGDQLVWLDYLTNNEGFYQNNNPQSTLENWNPTQGYLIKTANNFTLDISGFAEKHDSLTLNQGWNLIPVPSDTTLAIDALNTNPPGMIKIIKEACDVKVFWPEHGIFMLDQLTPGKSYFIKLEEDAVLYFR